MAHFSYILTSHNSEALIDRVLDGVLLSAGYGSQLYVVADGCTDSTIARIQSDRHAHLRRVVPTTIIETTDVHELLSINAGLRAAPQEGDGYNIILQDDVILQEVRLEEYIEKLYATIPRLGYVSLRLGFNIGSTDLTTAGYFAQTDEIESAYGAGVCGSMLLPGWFAARTVPIKSPVVLPCKLVREIGMLNESLAPYAYDDLEYAIRTTMAGYQNGVFGVKFESDVRWGGTRRPGHPDIQAVARCNAKRIAEAYAGVLQTLTLTGVQSTERANVVPADGPAYMEAIALWEAAQKRLAVMNS